MKKVFLFFAAFLMASMSSFAQMSDDAVVQYVKDGVQQGKSQQQLTRELAVKGVTKDQALRIKEQYEAQQRNSATKVQAATDVERSNPESQAEARTEMAGVKEINEGAIAVFGRNIFTNSSLTFEPSMNMPTPQNYRLGPGDQLVIEVWGASEANYTQKVSPEGYINIPQVGPLNVNGMTVQAASNLIKGKLSKIYSGMATTNVDLSTNAKVTLGQIRTIQINIMGEVANPGTYAISSFSTAFHALYRAGGVSGLGTLRGIRVLRGGRTVSTIDVYDYILRGKSDTDIRLQDGDMILVPTYEQLVEVSGNVKRPMWYEMKKGESLSTLLGYAGGFTSDAYSRAITVERNNGIEKSVATLGEMDFANFQLKDGDRIDVGAILQRYSNRVELKGAVYRPGFYEMGTGISTVRELITKADGPLDEAFLDHAVLHRENDDKTLEVIAVDLKAIMSGTSADIVLHKNDVLYVPSKYDLKEQGTISVAGDVFAPGTFPYAKNTKIEDIIIQAGGLLESASMVRVDVTRRIVDNTLTKKQKEIAKVFSFGVKDGFVIEGESGFILEPYDQVFVRRSPGYSPQINVGVWGEVEFEGEYTLSVRNERLTDVIAKAGGLSDYAYAKGARLERTMSEEEYMQARDLLDVIELQNMADDDSVKIDARSIRRVYNVAIDLEKALANPHSDFDLALREGDRIIIPQYNNIVTVRGTVRKQGTITYDPSKSLSYYISEAGGYGNRAKKSGTFILYPNGHTKELGRKAKASEIQPGSEIIVPAKHKNPWNINTTIAVLTTSLTTLATMATLIISVVR